MDKVVLKAYAKINLTLDVVGKRPNGYHDVQMVMQQIDLFDEVSVEPIESGIEILTDCGFIPNDQQNLAWRAAELFLKSKGIPSGVRIGIEKNIPVAAGLAGGSTDAAAVLEGCRQLFDPLMSLEALKTLGLQLGADVPFCLQGGAALAQGIGEVLTPIQGLEEGWIVVCKPNFGVSTREVYENLDWAGLRDHPDTSGMLKALEENDFSEICCLLSNVLETVTLQRYPEVRVLKERMNQYGARGVLMSGSGPTVFGLFKQADKAKKACDNLKRFYRQAYAVRPIGQMGEVL